MENLLPLVIYHGKCPDGFGAALAAYLVLGDDAEYLAAEYRHAPPASVAGRCVFILDFSYAPEVLERMANEAEKLVLLDHHQSAKEKVDGYQMRCTGCKPLFRFDLTKSGARLAWEYFHPGTQVPELIDYIQDRDLWKWQKKNSKPFLAALDNLPFTFKAWIPLLDMSPSAAAEFLQKGHHYQERFTALCHSIAEKAEPCSLLGQPGLWVSATSEVVSELASIMYERCGTYGMVLYVVDKKSVKVSLRSSETFDALPLAKAFGGGGHPKACSFSIRFDQLSALLDGTLSPTHPV